MTVVDKFKVPKDTNTLSDQTNFVAQAQTVQKTPSADLSTDGVCVFAIF